MAAISVRDLNDEVAARLRVRAAQHGRSMEAEVRAILTDAVLEADQDQPNLAQAVRQHFGSIGGADLQLPARADAPRAADLP